MKTPFILRLALVLCLAALVAGPASAGTRIGGGLHYLKTVGDMKDVAGFDDSALGFIGSLAFSGGLARLEANVEFIPDYAGTDELMWAPEGYVLFGQFIYAGAGIGIGHLGAFGWQDPFYDLRAGVDFNLGGLDLDVYAAYRFEKAKDLEAVDKNSLNALTFAAIVRFGGN
ncbi:MAG TPA: hypothetical protein PLQ13_08865 [Candidatus Krumholzibacteria bacterium]|nr:hypothetical protein [Candidatus Krumholzibacteria bacterium]